jgi:hypothetical protein
MRGFVIGALWGTFIAALTIWFNYEMSLRLVIFALLSGWLHEIAVWCMERVWVIPPLTDQEKKP